MWTTACVQVPGTSSSPTHPTGQDRAPGSGTSRELQGQERGNFRGQDRAPFLYCSQKAVVWARAMEIKCHDRGIVNVKSDSVINEFRISNEDFPSQICSNPFFAQVTLMTVQGIAPTSLGMTAGGELLVQTSAIT